MSDPLKWRIRVVTAEGKILFSAFTTRQEADRLANEAVELRHDVIAYVRNPVGSERRYWHEPA